MGWSVTPTLMFHLMVWPLVYCQDELTNNEEIIQTYRLHIAQDINQDNLALFYTSYNRYHVVCKCGQGWFYCLLDWYTEGFTSSLLDSRRDLDIERPIPGVNEDEVNTLKWAGRSWAACGYFHLFVTEVWSRSSWLLWSSRCPALLIVGDSSPAVEAVVGIGASRVLHGK